MTEKKLCEYMNELLNNTSEFYICSKPEDVICPIFGSEEFPLAGKYCSIEQLKKQKEYLSKYPILLEVIKKKTNVKA